MSAYLQRCDDYMETLAGETFTETINSDHEDLARFTSNLKKNSLHP